MKFNLVLESVVIILIFSALTGPALSDESIDLDPEGSDGAAWHQFHLDPQHRGASSSSAPRTNHTLWTREIGAQAGSSVSVAEGLVFVNCVDEIVALDQGTGETIWAAPFERNGDVCCSWFTPVYSDGRLYFSGMETKCLNATTGEEIWSFAPPSGRGAVDGSPAVEDGKVIASDWDGHHYRCLEEASEREIWNFTVEGAAQSTPAIADGRVVFGAWEWGLGGKIYCADLEEGSEIWSIQTENSPCGSAAVHDGTVYMTTYNFNGNGDLLALSLSDGSLLWRREISPTDSTPTLAEGKVYVCGGVEGFSSSKTYAFEAATGELVWETDEAEKIGDWRCSMAYADGLVFVGRPDFDDFGGTVALDAATGKVVWSHPGGGSSPAVADRMVFTVGKGRVYAFGGAGEEEDLQ
ncbi:PQQ-binding-like beta-propeller repeat protein [Methanothrix harundinacea]|uniref:Pyrrolo-quinoline quinone n=1 Tax=Methanothrix harundinacea (strain 6Ac) TaxID=1110509 RepID=G7WNW3_METH6|nr:PQQ-binding-like beta-propeller repeat protein [Methanothrix harundinacea]AET64723.1 Pyrrolo-quinoline quinone [Methanothrix harundinacea 6Ac]